MREQNSYRPRGLLANDRHGFADPLYLVAGFIGAGIWLAEWYANKKGWVSTYKNITDR